MISSKIAILIAFEVVWSLVIVWMFFHEERLVAFEKAICRKIKKKINRLKRDACVRYLSKQGIIIPKMKGDK